VYRLDKTMGKHLLFMLLFIGMISVATAQTNTFTSGTWNDPSIWLGGVPTGAVTANVNNPVEINTNITVAAGATYNIFQSATDFPGGTAYTLLVNGTLDVRGGTTYFGGALGSMTGGGGSSIRVRSGATLIITGPTSFANGTVVLIDAGGTLIINGDFDNNIAGAGSFTVQGLVQINGSYTSNGNVDVLGGGNLTTTGSITTVGMAGTVFGSTNNCSPGPCSGQNLCLGAGATNTISANQFICSGNSAVGLTGDAIASVLSYQWQSSITSSSSGFSNITGATARNYNPGTPTQTTWYRRIASITGCTGTSSAVVIAIIPSASWRGTTSTDWNEASNWCNNTLPTTATDVVIPAGVPFQPTVNTATIALCRNLTINNGATVTVDATQQLNVSGNLINNGPLSINGTIQFNGTVAQSISGSGFGSYNSVIINNSSGATPALTIPSTGINIVTQLTLTAGKVNLSNANLTIGTSSGAGTLSYTAGWLYGGNLTRWIGAGALTLGNAPGHFPIGSSTNYRPVFFGNTNIDTQGTIRVSHTSVFGAQAVSFNDSGTPIQVRSRSFWTIATGNSIASGNTFSLRTEGTGLGTVGAVTDLRLTQVGSASFGTPGTNAGSITNPQVNRTAIPTANLTNDFYWGSINSNATPLPVTLVSFSGYQVSDQIKLNWKTASELNFYFFSLEKSIDGKEFVEISKINGNGTTQEEHSYESIDKAPLIGKNYYRLKSVDFDGYAEYFSVISVDFSNDKQFYIYPNPTNGKSIKARTNFHMDEQSTIVFYNNLGVIVGRYGFTQSEGVIDFPVSLANGIYYAKLFSSDFSKTIRFEVE
jgi:hypothetical protein